jgi:hypothetical protein
MNPHPLPLPSGGEESDADTILLPTVKDAIQKTILVVIDEEGNTHLTGRRMDQSTGTDLVSTDIPKRIALKGEDGRKDEGEKRNRIKKLHGTSREAAVARRYLKVGGIRPIAPSRRSQPSRRPF